MTALIEPARTFRGVPFCSDPAALAAPLLGQAGLGEVADEAVLV